MAALLGAATVGVAAPSSDQDNLFAARLHGPFANSVRDQLNEMVIQTHLKFFGIDPGDDMPLTRAALYSSIPSLMPAEGYISSRFGIRRSPFTRRLTRHAGVDIAARYGSPVYAPADGVVTYAGWRKALGRMVMISHGYGIVTKYGHNSQLQVKVGDRVDRGQMIAKVGSTGRSTGTHLHYEVWINGQVVDPSQFMFDVPDRNLPSGENYVRIPFAADDFGPMGGDGDGDGVFYGPSADLAIGGELTFSDAPEIHASALNGEAPATYAGASVHSMAGLLIVLLLALSSGGVVFTAFRH